MEQTRMSANYAKLHEREPLDRCSGGAGVAVAVAKDADRCRPPWIPPSGLPALLDSDAPPTFAAPLTNQTQAPSQSSITVAEFIEHKFLPEYVALKTSAGRSYFRTILNHILPPEQVALIFAVNPGKMNHKLKAIPSWPYIDSLPLCAIDTEIIQHLTQTALKHGYSTQTAAHIRNVIRVMFSHAIRCGYYTGPNPANFATIPQMTRKESHALSLAQLKDVMTALHYPEKEVALFVLLTEMSVGEICALQWKYLNCSNINRLVDDEVILPKTIAVRNQSYRGEFGAVVASRRKSIRIPESFCSLLRDLKTRKQFIAPGDFVLVSRNGGRIHPQNLAARHLKTIGKALAMPWLSWLVFHRTRISLKAEYGRSLNQELEKIILALKSATHA